MSEGVNNCTFAGNVGKDPVLAGRGTPVLKFSIAVNERRKQGEEWVDHVEWIPVTVFGKRAEALAKILTKGSQITIVGKFRTTKYEKDGQTRYSTEIVADTIALQGGGQRGERRQEREEPAAQSGQVQGDDDEDSIPF
jgi:single-strand DNA-binding protein